MLERLYEPKKLAPRLAEHYQPLANTDPEHVIAVPGVGALTRSQALHHLQSANDEGQAICIHFATNTVNYLIDRNIEGPYSEAVIIEASGKRWKEEVAAEARTQDDNKKIREEYKSRNFPANTSAIS